MTDPIEPLYSDEEIEAARVLFAQPVSFMMGAVRMDGLPPADLPEVACAAREDLEDSHERLADMLAWVEGA